MSLSILKKKIQERKEPTQKWLDDNIDNRLSPGPYRAVRELDWILHEIEELEKEMPSDAGLFARGYAEGKRDCGYWSGRSEAEIRKLLSETSRNGMGQTGAYLDGFGSALEWVLSREKKEPIEWKGLPDGEKMATLIYADRAATEEEVKSLNEEIRKTGSVSSAPKEKCSTRFYEVGKAKEDYTICLLPKRHLPPCKPEKQEVSREIKCRCPDKHEGKSCAQQLREVLLRGEPEKCSECGGKGFTSKIEEDAISTSYTSHECSKGCQSPKPQWNAPKDYDAKANDPASLQGENGFPSGGYHPPKEKHVHDWKQTIMQPREAGLYAYLCRAEGCTESIRFVRSRKELDEPKEKCGVEHPDYPERRAKCGKPQLHGGHHLFFLEAVSREEKPFDENTPCENCSVSYLCHGPEVRTTGTNVFGNTYGLTCREYVPRKPVFTLAEVADLMEKLPWNKYFGDFKEDFEKDKTVEYSTDYMLEAIIAFFRERPDLVEEIRKGEL